MRADPDAGHHRADEASSDKEAEMAMLWTVVVIGFVLAVLTLAGWSLFEISPFGRHVDHYRDARTGKRRWKSPNLEDGHY